MADLSTTYLGLTLRNPFVAGASGYTANLDRIRQLEEAGAGALVTASLFEEQIQYESYRLEEDLSRFDNLSQEVVDVFPQLKHGGAKEHLMWVRRTKEAVRIPVIASLNAVNRDTWARYAQELEGAGADALELNFYATPSEAEPGAAEIEKEQVAAVRAVLKKVKVPVSVKLSSFYTTPLNFMRQLDQEGVRGFVLFNRLFQPDLDAEREANRYEHTVSAPGEHLAALRFTALAYGNLKGEVCASGGIFTAADAAKLLLAGATCVQVVSTLYRNKIGHLGALTRDLAAWLEARGYRDLAACRGRLSARKNSDPGFYRRAQYVKNLLRADYSD
jgi:dihydroorotate dehydrogenase (fumarate)